MQPTTETITAETPVWAIVELMGHVRYGGKVSKDNQFGTAMLRIDVPQPDGTFVSQLINPSMQTLCKALPVSDRTYKGEIKLASDKPVEVGLKIVPGSTKIIGENQEDLGTISDIGKKPKRPAPGYKNVIAPPRPIQGLLGQ